MFLNFFSVSKVNKPSTTTHISFLRDGSPSVNLRIYYCASAPSRALLDIRDTRDSRHVFFVFFRF